MRGAGCGSEGNKVQKQHRPACGRAVLTRSRMYKKQLVPLCPTSPWGYPRCRGRVCVDIPAAHLCATRGVVDLAIIPRQGWSKEIP